MNPLLKRQIKKYLTPDKKAGAEDFLTAVNDSYKTYEEQIAMLQRAMKLSSDELFEANQKLRDEAQTLKEINTNLEFILNSMNLSFKEKNTPNFNPAEYIKEQSAEILKINKQREELLKNLEKQNQELNEYAHMVSHDLKAPLRSIDTLINWFIDDNRDSLDEEKLKTLNLILFNVERMDLLIKGILDYSSIDKSNTENRTVDFNMLLDEILRTLIVPVNIKVNIKNSLPKVTGNYYRFRQLFQILIENAIKYNGKENGSIEIGSREKQETVEFYVKDNGIGIPEAYFNKIFDIFTKLDSNNQSSGIGLSIAKKIVLFYGGNIWLESTENKGTTFFFTLPKAWNSLTWTI